jgi:hypothetical protein
VGRVCVQACARAWDAAARLAPRPAHAACACGICVRAAARHAPLLRAHSPASSPASPPPAPHPPSHPLSR